MLAWSPSGLAKNGRCALAVLTSNSLLCIWDPSSDPTDSAVWYRASVINDTLSKYYNDAKRKSRWDATSESKSIKRKRIRVFSWAPVLVHSPLSDTGGRRTYILAVANDLSDLFLLRVKTTRDIEVVPCNIDTSGPAVPLKVLSSENPDGLLPHLRWDSWCLDRSLIHNILHLRINGFQISVSIQVEQQAESAFSVAAQVLEDSPYSLASVRGNPWNLATFEISSKCKAHLDHLITERERQFSAANNLYGRVTTKFWGSSRYGDYQAVCISLHPSVMVEYIVPSAEKSYLEFTHESYSDIASEDLDLLTFPWEVAPNMKPPFEAHAGPWEALIKYVYIC